MAIPSPTSPTLADLEYAYYLANTIAAFPLKIVMAESTYTSENTALNFEGYSFSVNTSDFLGTTENMAVGEGAFGPNLFSITLSETVTTSENSIVTAPFSPTTDKNVTVNDKVVTADPAVVNKA